jgi:hypothetical protein
MSRTIMTSTDGTNNYTPMVDFSATDASRDSNRSAPRADLAEIRRGIGLLFGPGDVIEVRIPKTGRYGVISGYFDDLERLAAELFRADCRYRPPGVYYTINPCVPALLGRAYNRLKERADLTTADTDIRLRRWLPVDLDPVRPAGISSSDEEHEAALARARLIRGELAGEGWGAPLLADSGNGAHLLYQIDQPNTPDALHTVAGLLSQLSGRFSDEHVKLDTTSGNAARIWKAYGTVCRKGDSIPGRPHRLSRVLEAAE